MPDMGPQEENAMVEACLSEQESGRHAFKDGWRSAHEYLTQRKTAADHASSQPVAAQRNPLLGEDRIELHWYGWGGPIGELSPLCDLTSAQAHQLVQQLTSLLTIEPGSDDA